MKKLYVRPALEIYGTELGQMVCASIDGVVGQGGNFEDENPNNNGQPGFGGYVEDGPPSTAKEFDLWGDLDW